MIQLSPHLSLAAAIASETAKRLELDNRPPLEHLANLKAWADAIYEPLVEHFGVAPHLSSGYRSTALNAATPRASKGSQHSRGEAGDLDQDDRDGPTNRELFDYIRRALPFDQLIWEYGTDDAPAWVHVSYTWHRPGRRQILRAVNGQPYAPWAGPA